MNLASAFAIALLVSELFAYNAGHPVDVSADANWLDGWQYRKAHTVYSATGAGVNYTAKIVVNYNKTFNPVLQSNVLNDDGCWCWFQDPKAVCYEGKTYFSWTRGNGDVGISCYDPSTERVKHFTLSYNFDKDDHSCPSILFRSDGRIVAFYTEHSGTIMRWRISSSPEDISSWSNEYTFTGAKSEICYPHPVRLSDENDTIYLFYRSLPSSGPGYWVYRKSHDGGETFGNEIDMLIFTRSSPYTKVVSNGRNKIHFAFGDCYFSCNPQSHLDIMYCYYENGSFHRADGSTIKNESQLPISDKSTVDMIYNSSAVGNHDAWAWDIALDSNEIPHIVFSELVSLTDHRYRYARWTGLQWTNSEICSAGGYIGDDPALTGIYSGGLCLDHNDPSIVYLSKQEGSGQFEIYKYYTNDGGMTWTENAITSNSTAQNCRPTFVINSTSAFKIIWWSGTYSHYTNYKTSLLGYSVNVVDSAEQDDEVSCEGRCRADFGDVRFAGSDGVTLLDYWIEEQVDGDHATFWVEIADDLSSASATIYMYYGNTSATTTSNGDATFVFFDDFDGGSLDLGKWVVRQGDVSVVSSELVLTGIASPRGIVDSLTTFGPYSSLHTRARLSQGITHTHHFCSMRESGTWSNRAGDLYTVNTGANKAHYVTVETDTTSFVYVALADVTAYHLYTAAWKLGESRVYQDDTPKATITTNVPSVDMSVVFYEGETANTYCYVDWCFVSKWVDPEPAHGAWGSHEAEKPTFTMNPTSVICRKLGEPFTIGIRALDVTNVFNFSFVIQFNNTLLSYISVVWHDLGTGTLIVEEAAGVIEVHVGTLTPISGNHDILSITFSVTYSHIWKNEERIPGWKNNQSGTISFQTVVLECSDGKVFSYVKGVSNELVVSEAVFTWMPIRGDLNNDGCVDIFDLRVLVMYFSVKEGDPLWIEASKYDLTNDSFVGINLLDLMVLSYNYGFEHK